MANSYVVTGGAGFIGSHIAAHLLQKGHHVRVIDNLSTGKQSNLDFLSSLNGNLRIYHNSITEYEIMRSAFEGVDVVFHHAALASVPYSVEHPLIVHEHCATGTLVVLKAAYDAQVRRVVYASSSAVYGENNADIQREDAIPAPISPYGAAKLAGEYYCQTFTQTYGLETVVLRYFNVFGPRQDPHSPYAAVIPKFIQRMIHGQPPIIFGDGTQTRDFTPIDNIVHANLLAADSAAAIGAIINIATGHPINLLTLVEKINQMLGASYKPIFQPPRAGDIQGSQADIERAKKLLAYHPIIDFDDALRQTIEFLKTQQM